MAVKLIIAQLLTSVLVLLIWIPQTKGSRLSISCSIDNCTSSNNTYCDNGVCACLRGYYRKGQHCLLRKIGESCAGTAYCIGVPNSQCVNDTCQCNHGYIPKNQSKECVRRKLSDKCNGNSECTAAIANSKCEKGACRCTDGYMRNGSLCLARKLGDVCAKLGDCSSVMKNTRCLRTKCPCANDSTCLLGENCTKNVDCNVDQEVKDCKSCTCSRGYKQMNDSFCGKFKLGDSCTKQADCLQIANGVCSHKEICECGPGSKADVNNEVCDEIQLRDGCTDSEDCKNVLNSGCVGGQCLCVLGYREDLREDGTFLLFCKANQIGDSCRSNDDCKVGNYMCKENVCSCSRGFSFVGSTGQCVEKRVQDTDCITTDDCLEHFDDTICDGLGTCACDNRHQLDNNGFRCVFKYLGDSCSVYEECNKSVLGSECVSGVCQCGDRYLPREDRMYCLFKRLGGRPCQSDSHCRQLVSNSICDVNKNNTCHCNVGYYSNERFDTCVEKRLQDECVSDEDCNTTNPHTLCSPVTQLCDCVPGFATPFVGTPQSLSSGDTFTKPVCTERKIAAQLCSTNEDCSSAIANSSCGSCLEAPEDASCNTFCRTGKPTTDDILISSNSTDDCPLQTCMCNKGFLAKNDGARCEARKLRDPCLLDDDCYTNIANSICWPDLNVCFCASGFIPAGLEVCKRRVVGDWCAVDADCEDAVASSHCDAPSSQQSGVCRCNSGYHGNDESAECRKRHIGDKTCAVDSDCSDAINNSYCHLGMCVCLQGYVRNFDHTHCFARRLHLDYCDTDLHCRSVINNSLCENYVCVCKSGFFEDDDNNMCVKRKIDDVCKLDKHCSDAVNNSACVNDVCRCVSGFVAMSNDSCTRRQIFDATCERDVDCRDAVLGSGCYNGTCLCNPGYYPTSNKTFCLKRKLEDRCNVTSHCTSVIPNSWCVSGHCSCVVGFDGHDNNTRCVKGPVIIGQPCHFTEQCKKIDPNANCTSRSNEPSVRVCVCRPLTFPSRNLSACIAYPDSVGDHCLHDAHCRQKLANTTCENNACNCSPGHFVDTNQTTCHKDPQHLGDFCQLDEHCLKTMNSSVCESNNTCVCHVNFTQASAANCTERPLLPRFLQKRREEPTKCQGACLNWTNSVCVLDDGLVESQCRCDFRFARRYLSVDCVPVQTYLLHLTVAKEMDRWDYKAVEFSDYHHSIKLNDSRRFADNITLDGLMPMFDNATNTTNPTTYPIIDRYVTSEVIGFEQTESAGVRAIILLHLTADYMNALPLVNVSSFLEESLTSSDGVLGESNFKVDPPFEGAFELKDFDECASDETNDCSKNAMCINTRGSFMCICKSKFDDVSTAKNRQKGRECVIPKTEEPRSDLCSSADCNTQWQFVAMAVTFFLLVVMAFITYEIIQRKQTFTARKLYEKFGTTQIRKLRKASMQRLKDRKKRMKEENRKKKEEERQKKDELKREKSDKRKKKEEGKQSKQDKKKQGDLEKGKKSADDSVEEIEEPDIESPSPIEATQTTSLIHASSTDDIQNIDIPNSQGSANMSDVEMGYSRRAVSPIEESPV